MNRYRVPIFLIFSLATPVDGCRACLFGCDFSTPSLRSAGKRQSLLLLVSSGMHGISHRDDCSIFMQVFAVWNSPT